MNRKLINKAALGIPALLVTFGVAAVTLNAQEDPATKKPPLGQGKGDREVRLARQLLLQEGQGRRFFAFGFQQVRLTQNRIARQVGRQ